ncbi:AraC-like DNA-binding protein [Variovorax boronicumulans]|uniref:AraC-like DNA-binding protein n=1 Tax=Variovorax boronicumulans TaxID=436515 RepID=A0AAW8DUD8_9BURK|nr:AraC family transcriptional regulator [Variovorax boronicumulans]MDP9877876.1 AraC-like DNA-binding protein [Variovorax boronicumulans]MDP9923160.1 AraC-like DNA-binding protein [Variovorax boronicumulans]
MSVVYRQLRQLMPDDWSARRVCFMHAAPADMRMARRLFSNRVEFGASFNGIVCAAADLSMPLATYAALEQYAQQYVEGLGASVAKSSSERVRQLVLMLLPSGNCTLEQIAGYLSVDARTVRRRLLNEGTSYQLLLDQVRKALVQRYLRGAPRKYAEIALLLGFNGPTSFSRWFRKQFGCSASA